MGKLDGKVAVIVGGGRNIGRASSKLFASEGAKIAIFDMDAERAAAVTEEVSEQGGECMYVLGEVQKVADIKSMIAQVVERYGQIDILLNCAAISDRKPMLELDDEDYLKIIEVTMNGTYYTCKYVAEQMVKQGTGGAIVNFSSGSAFSGNKQRVAYDMAKGAIVTLTMDMAVQLAQYGIRTNAIAPGNHRLAGRRHDRIRGPADEQPRRRTRRLPGGAGQRRPLPGQRRRPPPLRTDPQERRRRLRGVTERRTPPYPAPLPSLPDNRERSDRQERTRCRKDTNTSPRAAM